MNHVCAVLTFWHDGAIRQISQVNIKAIQANSQFTAAYNTTFVPHLKVQIQLNILHCEQEKKINWLSLVFL